MAALIKTVYFNSGSGQTISLKLDTLKYDAALLTSAGGTLTANTTGQNYPYRSVKAALKSGAIGKASVICKNPTTKKTRKIDVVYDKDKAATLANSLKAQKIKIGGFLKTDWDVEDVYLS